MGFFSLASSASHHVLTTSFNWIFATSTWLSAGTRAAFNKSVVSMSHYSASNGFSYLVNIAGCSLLKSDTFLSFYSRGTVTSPCRNYFIYWCWFSIIHCRNLNRSAFSSLRSFWEVPGPSWDELGPFLIPRISMIYRKREKKLKNKKMDRVQDSRKGISGKTRAV